ncbi:MAG: hypothetical protein ACLFU7_02565 [Armatimonadota bacterium]
MSVHRLMSVVAIAAMLIAVALPAFAQWEPNVNGCAQFRYEYSDDEGDGDFDTRRVRLNWKDAINNSGTTVRVQLDFGDLLSGDGNKVSAKDIWVMQPVNDTWSALAGFTTVRFGYELEYSSSKRLPLERSQAARSFFPGERGLGVYIGHAASETANVNFDLCYVDGMDSWERGDFDDAESLIARAEVPVGNGGAAGLSYMTSDIDLAGITAAQAGSANSSFSPNVFGAHLRYDSAIGGNSWGAQAEYYDGDWYDQKNHAVYDADGWYAQLEFSPEESAVSPFYRYDEFNAENVADYSRHTLGVAYEPWSSNRFTLQLEDIDMASADDTTVGVQWQVIYK